MDNSHRENLRVNHHHQIYNNSHNYTNNNSFHHVPHTPKSSNFVTTTNPHYTYEINNQFLNPLSRAYHHIITTAPHYFHFNNFHQNTKNCDSLHDDDSLSSISILSTSEESKIKVRWILSLGLLLPALAAIIGVVAWAVSAEVVMGVKREAALKNQQDFHNHQPINDDFLLDQLETQKFNFNSNKFRFNNEKLIKLKNNFGERLNENKLKQEFGDLNSEVNLNKNIFEKNLNTYSNTNITFLKPKIDLNKKFSLENQNLSLIQDSNQINSDNKLNTTSNKLNETNLLINKAASIKDNKLTFDLNNVKLNNIINNKTLNSGVHLVDSINEKLFKSLKNNFDNNNNNKSLNSIFPQEIYKSKLNPSIKELNEKKNLNLTNAQLYKNSLTNINKKSAGAQVAEVIDKLVSQRKGIAPHIVVVAPFRMNSNRNNNLNKKLNSTNQTKFKINQIQNKLVLNNKTTNKFPNNIKKKTINQTSVLLTNINRQNDDKTSASADDLSENDFIKQTNKIQTKNNNDKKIENKRDDENKNTKDEINDDNNKDDISDDNNKDDISDDNNKDDISDNNDKDDINNDNNKNDAIGDNNKDNKNNNNDKDTNKNFVKKKKKSNSFTVPIDENQNKNSVRKEKNNVNNKKLSFENDRLNKKLNLDELFDISIINENINNPEPINNLKNKNTLKSNKNYIINSFSSKNNKKNSNLLEQNKLLNIDNNFEDKVLSLGLNKNENSFLQSSFLRKKSSSSKQEFSEQERTKNEKYHESEFSHNVKTKTKKQETIYSSSSNIHNQHLEPNYEHQKNKQLNNYNQIIIQPSIQQTNYSKENEKKHSIKYSNHKKNYYNKNHEINHLGELFVHENINQNQNLKNQLTQNQDINSYNFGSHQTNQNIRIRFHNDTKQQNLNNNQYKNTNLVPYHRHQSNPKQQNTIHPQFTTGQNNYENDNLKNVQKINSNFDFNNVKSILNNNFNQVSKNQIHRSMNVDNYDNSIHLLNSKNHNYIMSLANSQPYFSNQQVFSESSPYMLFNLKNPFSSYLKLPPLDLNRQVLSQTGQLSEFNPIIDTSLIGNNANFHPQFYLPILKPQTFYKDDKSKKNFAIFEDQNNKKIQQLQSKNQQQFQLKLQPNYFDTNKQDNLNSNLQLVESSTKNNHKNNILDVADSNNAAMINFNLKNPPHKDKGLQMSFGGGPSSGGVQLITNPVGIFKSLLLPFFPKPRMNLNGKVVFGVVLEKGVNLKPNKPSPVIMVPHAKHSFFG